MRDRGRADPLGTGGLARAYRSAGRDALDASQFLTIWPEATLRVAIGYDTIGRLEHALADLEGVRVIDASYAAEVTFVLAVRCTDLRDVRVRLADLLQRPVDSFTEESSAHKPR